MKCIKHETVEAVAVCVHCGRTSGLFAAAAVAAWFMMPAPFLIYFMPACAVVLFAAGFWYQRAARQHNDP